VRLIGDVVLLKNGDHMTCEIKGLGKGTLFVSLDYFDGTISVELVLAG
jgi:hypothetical protein